MKSLQSLMSIDCCEDVIMNQKTNIRDTENIGIMTFSQDQLK